MSITVRLLGPEGYGVLAIFAAVTSLFYNFLAIPGGETITTYVTRSVKAGRREEAAATLRFALATALGLGAISYCLLVVFALIARGFLGVDSAHAATLIVFGTAGLLLAVHGESLAVLRLANRVSLGLVIVSAGTLTRIAVLVVAWVGGGGLFMVVLAHVAGAAVTGVGMFAAAAASAARAGLSGFLRSLSIRVPRDVVGFQVVSFTRATIASLSQNMDVLLLAELSSIAQVGLYRAARSLIDLARKPFRPITSGLQVELSRQWYSSERTALRRLVLRSVLLTTALSTAGFGLLAILHKPIMRIILGSEFSSAAQPLMIMIIGSSIVSRYLCAERTPCRDGSGWTIASCSDIRCTAILRRYPVARTSVWSNGRSVGKHYILRRFCYGLGTMGRLNTAPELREVARTRVGPVPLRD